MLSKIEIMLLTLLSYLKHSNGVLHVFCKALCTCYLISKIFNFDITDRIYSLFYSVDVSTHNTYTKVPSALFQEESKEQLCTGPVILFCHIAETWNVEKNVFI